MTHVSIIGLDLAKNVFQAHGADATGAAVLRKKLRRDQLLAFFTAQAPCVVAMEACPGAHHWGREIAKLGHTVKLIAPAYVKPFVKRQKNDAADAEAICEAAQRPTMRFVAVKSEAKQASAAVFRSRDILVGQRTQVINAIRGHLAEYGLVAPQGPSHVEQLIAQIEDPNSTVPQAARTCLKVLVGTLRHLQTQVATLDAEISARAKADATARRLMSVPGIGVVSVLAYVSTVEDPDRFTRSRSVGAHMGLTPRQYQSGEVDRSGRISRCGDTLARTLMYEAAVVILTRVKRASGLKDWAQAIAKRSGAGKARVALARKLCVILHSIWRSGEPFRWSEQPAGA